MTNNYYIKRLLLLAIICVVAGASRLSARYAHPNLIINAKDVRELRTEYKKYPLFYSEVKAAERRMDRVLVQPIEVPVPKDAVGPTAQRHKLNYMEMQLAGTLYTITGKVKYAGFIRTMLLKYAALYPTLPLNPASIKGKSPGKLFWQSLNETVWLVYTIQAYDAIYDWLSPADRKTIEDNLFRPMTQFFIVTRVQQFDLIHNHGTWMDAAVGMTGYVLHDTSMINKALYGSKEDGKAGFLRQLRTLFSPDGYYAEGPYYARYAMMPFFLFAEAIHNNQPGLRIFHYHNEVLKKAFYSLIQLTNTNGDFFPFNDAIKAKNFDSPEVVIALDMTYEHYGHDKSILWVAKKQGSVMLTDAGLEVARALVQDPHPKPFDYKSVQYVDGPDGTGGGVGILRYGPFKDLTTLFMKYTSHGLSHGHYDGLECLLYDQGRQILQDYGSARFVNVEPKFGGRYLPENKSWARQTIAHNTVTVDERSQYKADIRIAEKYHADTSFFSCTNKDFQYMSAKLNTAYPGVQEQRTMALVKVPDLPKPVVIDVFRVVSDKTHTYDLPFYYMGQEVYTNVKYTAFDKVQHAMGKKNGYQHLWKVAGGRSAGPVIFTWLKGKRYYTITTAAGDSTEVYYTRIGAGDPNFNLRPDPGVMFRYVGQSHVFATVLEPHGLYNPVSELSEGATGDIDSVVVLASNNVGTVVKVTGRNIDRLLMISNGPASNTEQHTVSAEGVEYRWTGNIAFRQNAK